jgi:hypothetical protein
MWRDFNVEHCQEDMYYRRTLTHDDTIITYKCPPCNAQLRKLSNLFEHIESDLCNQKLNNPIIRRFRNHLALHV